MNDLERQCKIEKLKRNQERLDRYGPIFIGAGFVIGGVVGTLVGCHYFHDLAVFGTLGGMAAGVQYAGLAIGDSEQDIIDEIDNLSEHLDERNLTYDRRT